MKSWKRTLAIAAVIALASQFYWNLFTDQFRISFAVILLPVLIMTAGIQIPVMRICLVTASVVFLLRAGILLAGGQAMAETLQAVLPGALFYVNYGIMFAILVGNRHTVGAKRLAIAVFTGDFAANLIEVAMQGGLQGNMIPQPEVAVNLLLIALIRTVFVGIVFYIEYKYRALLAHEEHEKRYQRLFLMTTGLKSEIYLMRKNMEEIERVMSNAYRLYEEILKMELPSDMQQMGLDIARDVHEIKKDYIRIIQGIEKEIDQEYDEERMSLQDMLKILESSAYQVLDEKGMETVLNFRCRDDFTTREHYALMAILKNLVSNAVEAIEMKKKGTVISIDEWKEGDTYRFTVTDDGPGIASRNLSHIFQMGYSTKFDEKTGNIYRGVGLCGVKNAVEEKFKGSITVESEKGRGTRFQITIPAAVLEEL